MAKKDFKDNSEDMLARITSSEMTASAQSEFKALERLKAKPSSEEPEKKDDLGGTASKTEHTSIYTDKIYEETKTERMQLVMRPTIKKFIKKAAADDGISVNEFIERLVMREREKRK